MEEEGARAKGTQGTPGIPGILCIPGRSNDSKVPLLHGQVIPVGSEV